MAAIPAIVHLVGEDAIYGELDEVPNPTHNFVFMRNVRKKDGKELAFLTDGAEVFLYAWHKITFIEIMQDVHLAPSGAGVVSAPGLVGAGSGQKPAAGTTVLGFFSDDEN